jgi:hypothetical protein
VEDISISGNMNLTRFRFKGVWFCSLLSGADYVVSNYMILIK